jgi:hypothetical protein
MVGLLGDRAAPVAPQMNASQAASTNDPICATKPMTMKTNCPAASANRVARSE